MLRYDPGTSGNAQVLPLRDTLGHAALMAGLGVARSQSGGGCPTVDTEPPLVAIDAVLLYSEISPYEVLQSGLEKQLTAVLMDGGAPPWMAPGRRGGPERERRVRLLLKVLAGCPREPKQLVDPFVPTACLTAPLVMKVYDIPETD